MIAWGAIGTRSFSRYPLTMPTPFRQFSIRQVSSELVDTFGRQHSYLRISLTEKCNLRCKYCMPAQGVTLTPRELNMTLEERKQAIQIFAGMGVKKIRFTGGEPTISNQLLELVRFASEQVESVAITSNGILLRDALPALQQAGLRSVNISLDTLQENKFQEISRRDGKLLRRVLASIY
ncbi:radical SAM protein, partial [archaeon]